MGFQGGSTKNISVDRVFAPLQYLLYQLIAIAKGYRMSNKTGSGFRTIYQPACHYYDDLYRATSNGVVVNLQCCKDRASSFRTLRTVTQEAWDAFFWENRLFYPVIKDYVSILAKFAMESTVSEDDEYRKDRCA